VRRIVVGVAGGRETFLIGKHDQFRLVPVVDLTGYITGTGSRPGLDA